MADYHDRKRLDAAARAQRKREDEAAALANQLKAQAARAELERQNAAAKREQDREDFLAASQIKEQRRAQRTQRLRARLSGVRRWLAEHVVDLLIYPLALASAVLAIPAMARSGVAIYGSSSGVVLPVLSELGMWAFAIAVQVRRRKNPDVSVWALQVGIVVFAAYGVVLNFLDGARHGLDAGLVMALASVAGVIAHQLVTASARRTRAEAVT
ncbi:hypothetical protein QDK53_41975, partial [Amycolatopsis magusensis]|nr:hypothetical protein [Amycolatopsis magusensis]